MAPPTRHSMWMTDTGPDDYTELDPGSARTPAEYVDLLRRLRDGSGLTYRQIQHRARAAGQELPRSTLSAMLSRGSLPREALVTALVRACGGSPEEAARWVEARKRIASAAPGATSDQPAADSGRVPRVLGGRWSAWTAAGLVIGVVVAAGVVAAKSRDGESTADTGTRRTQSPSASQPAPSSNAALPPPGPYRIRVERTSLCLAEDPAQDDGRIYQASCERSSPPIVLEARGRGVYRLRLTHPRLGPRCIAVDGGIPAEGDTVSAGACGTRPSEEFRLEPVTTPVRGFRVRPAHNDLCLGVHDSMQEWAIAHQLPCYPTEDGQVFTFRPPSSP